MSTRDRWSTVKSTVTGYKKSSDCDDTHPHIPPHMDGLWMRDNNGTGPQVQVYVHGKDGEMLTVPRIDQDG